MDLVIAAIMLLILLPVVAMGTAVGWFWAHFALQAIEQIFR